MSIENATSFINALGTYPTLRAKLVGTPEGHWERIVDIANEAGYHFDVKDLHAVVPPAFFKGEGQNPEAGWSMETLKPKPGTVQALAFIEAMGTDEDLRQRMLRIPEGDWSAVVEIARRAGFLCTVDELLAAVPESFFEGAGKNPEAGWKKP